MTHLLLGVNIDHIATLRQVRGSVYPDPVQAAFVAEQAGADSITVHLREDARHIQKRDILLLNQTLTTKMNLEMALTAEMLELALQIRPKDCCLVPEKREELTTEGGLDVLAHEAELTQACRQLTAAGIRVSLFIDADHQQISAAQRVGAPVIELHTGRYADTQGAEQKHELERIQSGARFAHALGLQVNAGHGLNYHNVQPIAAISDIQELNIGHAIICQALFSGLAQAVAEMKRLMREVRPWR